MISIVFLVVGAFTGFIFACILIGGKYESKRIFDAAYDIGYEDGRDSGFDGGFDYGCAFSDYLNAGGVCDSAPQTGPKTPTTDAPDASGSSCS